MNSRLEVANRLFNFMKLLPAGLRNIPLAVYARTAQLFLKRRQFPSILTFFITNNCNAKCKHCFYGRYLNKKTEELSLIDIKNIITSFKKQLHTVSLTGGEPFLRNDLVDICKLFWKINKAKKICLPTNGFDSERILTRVNEILKNVGSEINVQVSLDGLEQTHDRIRGVRGAFGKAASTIEKLKKIKSVYSNFDVVILTTIMKENYKEIPELMNYVKSAFGIHHGFHLLRSNSYVFDLDNSIANDFYPCDELYSLPDLSELTRINEAIDEDLNNNSHDPFMSRIDILLRYYLLQVLRNKKRIIPCLAGEIDGIIYPSGDVALCEMTRPIGNLREFNLDFQKLWKSPQAEALRKEIIKCACIHSCNMLNSMRHHYPSLRKIFQ